LPCFFLSLGRAVFFPTYPSWLILFNRQSKINNHKSQMPTSPHIPPCDDIIILKEKVAALETWRASTQMDLKEIHDVISQVKLLMSLSIGGGGLICRTQRRDSLWRAVGRSSFARRAFRWGGYLL
jgi:hypothetical protein